MLGCCENTSLVFSCQTPSSTGEGGNWIVSNDQNHILTWWLRWIMTPKGGWPNCERINLMYIWWSNLPHDPMIANSCLYKKVNHFVEKPLDFLLRPSDDPTAATDWRWRPCFAITNYQGCTQFTQSSTNNLVLAI